MENIKSQIQKLPEYVQVDLKGQIDNSEIIKYLKSTAISFFIHVSETEGGVPVCLSEASAFGIPLIATDICGIPEIVNNETGHLIPLYFKAGDVANYIEKQHGSGEIYNKGYRENIRAFYLKNFYAPKNYSDLSEQLISI
jgi:glycosyltransferase involved in cell wall biosynthesis